MRNIIIALITFSLIITACASSGSSGKSRRSRALGGRVAKAPVRTGVPDTPEKLDRKAQRDLVDKSEIARLGITLAEYSDRNDTTVIKINTSTDASGSPVVELFNKAVLDFEQEKYGTACQKIQQYVETFIPGDSLYYEASFLWSECLIIRDDLATAETILTGIIADNNKVPGTVMEKSLVRLGQIYCVIGETAEAKRLFSIMKKKFPKSMYLKLANCGAVR